MAMKSADDPEFVEIRKYAGLKQSLGPRLAREPELRARMQELFLVALRETGSIRASSNWIGITPKTAWAWKNEYPEFKEKCDLAIESWIGDLEEIGQRRGKVISDQMLKFMLERRARKDYGREVTVTGDPERPIHIRGNIEGLDPMTLRIEIYKLEKELSIPPTLSRLTDEDIRIVERQLANASADVTAKALAPALATAADDEDDEDDE